MTLEARLLEARMHREFAEADYLIRGLRAFIEECVEEIHGNQHGHGHWMRCQEPRCVNAQDIVRATRGWQPPPYPRGS